MDLFIIAETISLVGKIIIAYTAISVHHRVMKEHRIDVSVFKSMKKEQKMALLGIIFLILGYFLIILDHTFQKLI